MAAVVQRSTTAATTTVTRRRTAKGRTSQRPASGAARRGCQRWFRGRIKVSSWATAWTSTHAGRLTRIRYVLSSWGCQLGRWDTGHRTTIPTPRSPCRSLSRVRGRQLKRKPRRKFDGDKTSTFRTSCSGRPAPQAVRIARRSTATSTQRAFTVWLMSSTSNFFESGPTLRRSHRGARLHTTHYGPQPIGESAPCYNSSAGSRLDRRRKRQHDGNGDRSAAGRSERHSRQLSRTPASTAAAALVSGLTRGVLGRVTTRSSRSTLAPRAPRRPLRSSRSWA